MTRVRSLLFTLISISIALPAFLANPSFAAKGNGTTMIGHITFSKGQVLVRSKGKWLRLEKTPFALYSTDRVVTKSGRASIDLVDGGVVRMNVDTSLKIVRRTGANGFFSSKVRSTEVNVLVGDVWFDIKLSKGKRMRFRSPSMTAAIRGTEGNLQVGLDGQSNLDLISGKTDNSGTFTQNPSSSDTKSGTELVPSSQSFLGSNLMRSVDSAVQAQELADASHEKAMELKRKAEELQRRINGSAGKAFVSHSLARSAYSEALAKAFIAAITEEIESAEHLGDRDLISDAREKIEAARASLNETVDHSREARSMAESVNFTSSSSKLTSALSHMVSTLADAAAAKAETVRAYTYASIAHVSGDTKAAGLAESYAMKAASSSAHIDGLRSTMSSLVQEISEGIENGKAKAILTASLTVSKVSSANAACASTHANAAMESMSEDDRSLAIAAKASDMAENLCADSAPLTRNLIFLINANEQSILDEMLLKATELDDKVHELSNGGETPETIPGDIEGAEEPLPSEIPAEDEGEEEAAVEVDTSTMLFGPILESGTGDMNVSPYVP